MQDTLDNKIIKATKWSFITEIITRLIGPITNMILARILAPEAFGVVATITMLVSFADIFADAGFQKYLIQHEFNNEEERLKTINVAFWTNLVVAITLWVIIVVYSESLASMLGDRKMDKVIMVACMQLPITAFSSIQMSIYRRNFNFKTLFFVRVVSVFIPFIVTIPLAFAGYSYWSLIIGNLCGSISNAIILTMKSEWKPKYFYSFNILRNMISFSMWTLIESISIWLTTWVDSFIIGSTLSTYYLGLYKNSLTTVNGIFGLIISATTPILFASLAQVQSNNQIFNKIFFNVQKMVSYIVLPMSLGMFIYSDIVVNVFLGKQWAEASEVVGIWSLISGVVIIIGHYSSEVYRAKGRPKLSFFAQILHLIVLVPVCIIASSYGFEVLVKVRTLIRLQGIIVHMIIMQFIIGISIKDIWSNIRVPVICTFLMGVVGIMLKKSSIGIGFDILSIMICIICYILFLLCFPTSRTDVLIVINKVKCLEKHKIKSENTSIS